MPGPFTSPCLYVHTFSPTQHILFIPLSPSLAILDHESWSIALSVCHHLDPLHLIPSPQSRFNTGLQLAEIGNEHLPHFSLAGLTRL